MLHTDDVMEIFFWQWQIARIWSKTFGPFVFLQVKDSFNKCYSPLKVELHDTATYSNTQVNIFSEEVKKKKTNRNLHVCGNQCQGIFKKKHLH